MINNLGTWSTPISLDLITFSSWLYHLSCHAHWTKQLSQRHEKSDIPLVRRHFHWCYSWNAIKRCLFELLLLKTNCQKKDISWCILIPRTFNASNFTSTGWIILENFESRLQYPAGAVSNGQSYKLKGHDMLSNESNKLLLISSIQMVVAYLKC